MSNVLDFPVRQQARPGINFDSKAWEGISEETCSWVFMQHIRVFMNEHDDGGLLKEIDRMQTSGAWQHMGRERQIAVLAFAAGVVETIRSCR